MPAAFTARRYSPQEAAALAGVRLQRVQNAITERQLGRNFAVSADGRRRLDLPALLALAAVARLGEVRIAPRALYRAFRKAGLPRGQVRIGEAVTIDAGHLLGAVMRNIALYEVARERIVEDPSVMGGVPVVKGTRIPARMLHARLAGGDSVSSILEDYPYLDRKTVEAAALYVAANPARGRPKRQAAQANA